MRTRVQIIEELDDNIARNPNSAEAYYNRAMLHIDGESIMSEQEYLRFIEYYGSKEEDDIEDEFENWNDPLIDLDKAISLNPNYVDAYYQRGLLYMEDEYNEKALTDFDKVISLDPNHKQVYMSKSEVCREENMFDDALVCGDKLLELDPENDEAHKLRIEAFKSKKDFKNFLIACQWWLDRNGEDAEVYASRANYYSGANEYERALDDIEKAIEFENDEGKLISYHVNESIIYRGLSRIDDALSALKIAEGIAFEMLGIGTGKGKKKNKEPYGGYRDTTAASVYVNFIISQITEIYKDRSMYNEALEYANKALRLSPSDIYMYYFKIQIYIEQDRYPEAVTAFDTMLRLSKEASNHWVNNARKLMEQLARRGKIKRSEAGLPEEERRKVECKKEEYEQVEYEEQEPRSIWQTIKDFFKDI